MSQEYSGELDGEIGDLIIELKEEYEITDEKKLAEHLYTYPQDYPDCSIDDIRGFAYENIENYRNGGTITATLPEIQRNIKKAVKKTNEQHRLTFGATVAVLERHLTGFGMEIESFDHNIARITYNGEAVADVAGTDGLFDYYHLYDDDEGILFFDDADVA